MKNSLQSWFLNNQIKLMLFDLDDTFIETNHLFLKRFDICKELIIKGDKTLDASEVAAKIAAINIESFKMMGSNLEKRWPYVTKQLVKHYMIEDTSIAKNMLKTLLSLYQELPAIKPGAVETLETLSSQNIHLGLVTHANESWTNYKLEKLGLRLYFEKVYIIDENAFKTAQSWLEAMNNFKIKPENTAIIGDSLRSDMQPGYEAGVAKLFWIHEDSAWSFYHQGDVPQGTIEVKGIASLIPVIESL